MTEPRWMLLPLVLVLGALLLPGCSHEVKIGAVISQSGGVAKPYGDRVTKGMKLAVEQINAAGGVNGGNVTLIFKDDATNPNVGAQAATELIEKEGVVAIIGAISSRVTLAIAPICESAGIVLLSPSSSANAITDAGDWIWRNWPADQLEGTAMAKFAKEEVGAERVVIFAEKGSWGEGLADVFTSQYEGRFRSVERRFEFDEATMGQLPAMIEEAKGLNPDACYLVAYVQELVQLLQLLEQAEMDTVLMSTSSVTADIGRHAGPSAENMVYPQVVFDLDSREPAVAAFVSAYRQEYNEDPDIYAAHGYDAVRLVAAAITSAGSTHPKSIRQGLGAIENFDGAAGRTSFNSDGDVVRWPRVYIIRDGTPIPYDELKDRGGSLFD